jgi:hypothetical protein
MTREELVRLTVLMHIADACEEPVHVYQSGAACLGPCGLWVAPEEIQQALTELTQAGLAKAYKLSPPQKELDDVPPFDDSSDYYFWITEDGLLNLTAGRAREDWPLDDLHDVIPGWLGVSN